MAGLPFRTVYVDRRTVAVSRIIAHDAFGRPRTDVLMDNYKETEGMAFPYRLVVLRREGYRLQLKLGKPKLNRALDPKLFEPGSRPGWRQINLDQEPITNAKAFRGE